MTAPKLSKVDRDVLREFAAELKRLTNFPLEDGVVEQAIKAVEPKLKKEA